MSALAKRGICFPSKGLTEELVRIFMEDSDCEDEEFKGFEEHNPKAVTSERSDHEDDEDSTASVMRTRLCVPFGFPVRKRGHAQEKSVETGKQQEQDEPRVRSRETRKREELKTDEEDGPIPALNVDSAEDSEDAEMESNALEKRVNNIKENKAMLDKLLADLNLTPELSLTKMTSVTTPSKKKKASPRERQSIRRNPARSARPFAHFGVVDLPVSRSKARAHLLEVKRGRIMTKLLEVHQQSERALRKRSGRGAAQVVKDITGEELENVAYTSKDKIYDKEHGSTCHQCRQKTLDTKTVCRNLKCTGVRGQFCGPCLRNRYGEDIRTTLLDATWVCPPCQGVCNCSFCRKRDGRCATGTLVHMAKSCGHTNVKEFLDSLPKECQRS